MPKDLKSLATGVHGVVIVGGGFAGLQAARALKSGQVDVTLVNRRNFHIFQPLLYQVATGSLSPSEIASPLRSVFRRQCNVRVLLGIGTRIDPAARQVLLEDGALIDYDTLVAATGANTSDYGHDS